MSKGKSLSEKSRNTTQLSEARAIYQSLKDLKAIVDVMGWIASRFDKAVDNVENTGGVLQQLVGVDDVLREQKEYLTESMDRLDKTLLLILRKLDGNGQLSVKELNEIKASTKELEIQAIKSRLRSLRTQIIQHQANINSLEEEQSLSGPDFRITNEIIRQQRLIEEKREDILALERDLK